MRINFRRPLALRMPLNSPFSRRSQVGPAPSQGSVVSITSCVQGESDYFSYELQSKLDKLIICNFFNTVSVMPHRLYYYLMKVKVKIKLYGRRDLFWLFRVAGKE